MIREILFRAKRLDNNEWIYGDLAKNKGGSDFIRSWNYKVYSSYEIDSSTIGQYIGLSDKNGKKIFEGDIVKTKYERLCYVEWNPYAMCYDMKPILDLDNINRKVPDSWDIWYLHNLEVVDNIYDNKGNYKIIRRIK